MANQRRVANPAAGRRKKGRHRNPRRHPSVSVWLGAGAVTVGVGAALASGQAVASASTGDDTGASASADRTAAGNPGPERETPGSAGAASTDDGLTGRPTRLSPANRAEERDAKNNRNNGFRDDSVRASLEATSAKKTAQEGVPGNDAVRNLGVRKTVRVAVAPQRPGVAVEPTDVGVQPFTDAAESASAPVLVSASGGQATGVTAAAAADPTLQAAGDPNYGTHETIDLGGTPTNVTISANGGRAFVVVGGSVKIVDIGASAPVISGTATVGSSPNTVAASADGTRAYVTNSGSGTVSIIETALLSGAAPTVLPPVLVGSNPTGVAVSANGNRAYVANTGSGTVSIIDYDKSLPLSLRTPKVTTILVGSSPTSITTNSAGTIAYVTNSGGDTVSIIRYNGGTATVTPVTVAASPTSVKISTTGTKAIVYSRGGIISIIDASGSTPVATTVPGVHYSYSDTPGFVAISGDGRNAFVSEHDSGRVAIIDTAAPTAAPMYASFGDYPHSIVSLRTGALAFTVAHDALYVVDVKTGQVAPVYVPADNNSSEFQRIAINANGSRVIAVDNSGNLTAFYYQSDDSTDNPVDETIRSWISSLGTTFADLGYLTKNSALKRISDGLGIGTILGSLVRGNFGDALYDGVQFVAGALEWVGRVPVLGILPGAAGLFLDTMSYAIRDSVQNPPADFGTIANYVVKHPAGAYAGAANGVIGLVANTAGHFIPEAVVKPVAEGLMKVNNTIGDAVDRGINNVFSGRWPWDNG